MAQTVVLFVKSKDDAFKAYEHFVDDTHATAIIVGPSKLLTDAATQISSVEPGSEYYIVIGTNAGGMADPALSPAGP